MSGLQQQSVMIENLHLRIERMLTERSNADRTRGNCQLQINRLKNIQAGLRSQSTPEAQKLRMDLTGWENRHRTVSTQLQNIAQNLEAAVNQRTNAQARLEEMQEARSRQTAAMAARGRGGGMMRGGRRRH